MSYANAGCVPVNARCSDKSTCLGPRNVAALSIRALSAAAAGLMTVGCGTHAILNITAPSSTVAGSPFTITVTAMVGASRDTIINSPVHFTSSDKAAVLPADYYFTPNDAGSHTFTNGVTLRTAGSQTITGTVIGAPGINGTASVTVSAANAMRFNVSAPSRSFRSNTP